MIKNHRKNPKLYHALLSVALVFTFVLSVNAISAQHADALYFISEADAAQEAAAPLAARVVVSGSPDAQVRFSPGQAVCITSGSETLHTEAYGGEGVLSLLSRHGITPSPLEMVHVDLSGEEVLVELTAEFTCYETAVESVAYTTLTIPDHDRPKGEIEIVQAGQAGTREVVYELYYADGELVSRQAVEEHNSTAVPEILYLGTLVEEPAPGDTIRSVRTNEDGSGYLLMASGDSLHFTGSMAVQCTAYTTGHGGVGTVTYTGTTVRRGCVAVDKNVIPLGTNMFIATESGSYTYGMARAEDTGVRGAKIDLYMDSYEECIAFGRRNSVAYFLD